MEKLRDFDSERNDLILKYENEIANLNDCVNSMAESKKTKDIINNRNNIEIIRTISPLTSQISCEILEL